MKDTVQLSSEGPRATITLNDPAKHNRLDPAGLSRLRQAIEEPDGRPDVRVTVLTGAGEFIDIDLDADFAVIATSTDGDD
jgi:enoyl-CoA hydratase/carnithine racemase